MKINSVHVTKRFFPPLFCLQTGLTVDFARASITSLATDLPTTTELSSTTEPPSSTTAQLPREDRRRQDQRLSDGAIVGIVIGVLFVVILLSVLIVTIVALGYSKSRRRKNFKVERSRNLSNVYVEVPIKDGVDENVLTSSWQAVSMSEGDKYTAVPTSDNTESSPDTNEDTVL